MICALSLTPSVAVRAAGPGDAEFFETRIRPVLADNCYACHTTSKMGGLQLTSKERAVRGGASGPAIRPGNSKGSLLIQVVAQTHDRLKMPPSGKLSDQQIQDLRAWVDAGAVWPETDDEALLAPDVKATEYVISPQQRGFWSYQPVDRPAPPAVRNAAWARTGVDRFVLARLEEAGVEPNERAGKRELIRRATLDLVGLPPTPQEVADFLADDSPEAFARVVDRLLASPHYGERWGRYWLDLARYADGKLGTAVDDPYANAFRYRDWVIEALNDDLPYDQFVRAQLAADLLPEPDRSKHLAALGFLALYPGGDDRVDVTTKTFLGLTVGCAQCHNHKYDPIPTKDFYSLQGIFSSSEVHEYPLAPEEEVQAWKDAKAAVDHQKAAINKFIEDQSASLRKILFTQTAEYMMATRSVIQGKAEPAQAAQAAGLDEEILGRWVRYLRDTQIEHPFLADWFAVNERGGSEEAVLAAAEAFERTVLAVDKEKEEIEDINYVRLGGAKGVADEKTRQYTNLEFLDLKKWYLWRDLAFNPYSPEGFKFDGGVFYFGTKKGFEVDRFLSGPWMAHLERMRAELKDLEDALPPQYPFIHGMRDKDKPEDLRVAIRGDKENLGEVAPRAFLHILCDSQPEPYKQGSGRLELANSIVSPSNPLTARVMVNRLWMGHFGVGLVETPSNYGQMGERPTHPALLDYLAGRFVDSGWSMKALHREIMLSSTYQSSIEHNEKSAAVDPENKLYWRANLVERLDAEALRDSMLAVAGTLDPAVGGPAQDFGEELHRRAVYGNVSRTQPDRSMALLDFPDPNATSEKRARTQGPMLRLFFMNNEFVIEQAQALAERVRQEAPDGETDRIRRAYELLYARPPSEAEIKLGLEYLAADESAWPRYAQALLASSEFRSVR
ncbi:MAG: DUF1553 domain-containing protein [Acidobacteria bacterium]|nr:DUF1553 domain-containing protein [Acidobacteriota bacterium]